MRIDRLFAGVLLLVGILGVVMVAWHFLDPQHCREVLCVDSDSYTTKFALVQLTFAVAGFVIGYAFLEKTRSSMHRKAKIYGGVFLLIMGSGDLVMNLVAYAKGVYHSIAFTFLSSESAALADILCDTGAIWLGMYLLMTYRPAKRRLPKRH